MQVLNHIVIIYHALAGTSYATDEDDADNSSAWKQLLRPEVLRPFRRMICNFIAINLLVKMHSLYFIKFIYEYIRQFDFLDFEIVSDLELLI